METDLGEGEGQLADRSRLSGRRDPRISHAFPPSFGVCGLFCFLLHGTELEQKDELCRVSRSLAISRAPIARRHPLWGDAIPSLFQYGPLIPGKLPPATSTPLPSETAFPWQMWRRPGR